MKEKISSLDIEMLIDAAIKAREYSYSPYSNFSVGSALLTSDKVIYSGCNVESASYTPTICAERVAVSKAVSEGHRDIEAIAIVGSSDMTYPCGVCRQFIREFGEDITIIVANSKDDYRIYGLEELLPNSFGPEDLK